MTVSHLLSSHHTHLSFSWGPCLLTLPPENWSNQKGLHHHITTKTNTLCPQGFLPTVTKDQVSFSPETSRPLAPIFPHPSQGLCSSNYSFSSAPSLLLPLSECDPVLPILKSRKEKNKTKLPLPHIFTQPRPYFSAVLHREISWRLLTVSASTSSSPFLPSAPSAWSCSTEPQAAESTRMPCLHPTPPLTQSVPLPPCRPLSPPDCEHPLLVLLPICWLPLDQLFRQICFIFLTSER